MSEIKIEQPKNLVLKRGQKERSSMFNRYAPA